MDALRDMKGQVYLAAKQLDCSHTAIYNYVNEYPEVAAIKEYYDEETTDIAVLKLRDAILSNEPWAIKMQLMTKGKKRGYVERTELTGADGEAMKHTIKFVEIVNGSVED